MYSDIKLGLCPMGKFVFSHEDAKTQKKSIENKLTALKVDYVGIDSILEDGIVRTYGDIELVVNHFKMQNIDGLFIPHCNFGTESATGMIAKKLGVPVLLWGPRDDAPLEDGTRLRDSLCGMFAASKILVKLEVPFTYIENCRVDDVEFYEGFDTFMRAVNVVKRLKGAKIGIVGNRIDFFWSTIINENELLQKFGIEILPMDLAKTIRRTKEKAAIEKTKYLTEIKKWETQIDISEMSDIAMINVLALRDVLYEFAIDNKLAALAVESFMTIIDELDACISFAQVLVSDMGIPCICESDIHGAVSSIIAEAVTLNTTPSFFADLTVRHPENDKGLLLWHDAFPLSLKDPNCEGKLGGHWILPGFKPGMAHWKLKDGDITIIRFDGEKGDYKLIAKESGTIEGPFTQNTYVWVEMDNWKEFERKIIEGPYIHHTSCVYGKYSKALEEACRYINDLEFDT